MESKGRTADGSGAPASYLEGIMSKHTHRAVKSLSKDYAWTHCVSHYPEHNERPHGNIERIDTCSCGARRSSEHNGGRAVYGSWDEQFAEAGR